MKKLFLFFLSLTCLTANAQYTKTRTSSANQKPTLLTQYENLKLSHHSQDRVDLKFPDYLATTIASQVSYANVNPTLLAPSQSVQGYWSGKRMMTSGLNGRFQAIQSFDIQGNLRESKATYQFTNRKKR